MHLLLSLLLLLLLQHAAAAPPQPAAPSWNNFNQQSLQTVLISIEERLRVLDTLYSPRYTPRWEISIEQQSRRMETIESRLGRLETLLELRLDKLSEIMSARQLKEELSKDQINRKLDSTYERLNHRLGYLEARLDVSIAKLQSTIETDVGRIERLETTAAGRQSDIEAELADIGTGINDIKKHIIAFEQQHNRSLVTIIENEKHMMVEMDNLTTQIDDLHVGYNKTRTTQELNDDEGTVHQETLKKNINLIVDKVTSSIDRNANNFITKANNMYNDMWRRTQVLEGLAKDSMSLSNATRRELQDGIRTIAVQMGRRGLFQSDRDRQEGSMDIALDTLGLVQRRLNELGRKFDSSFQMLMLAQNLFLESCHRIQLDEPQLETKLTKVLERILDAITNRSMNTDHEVKTLQELLKSHSSRMTQTLDQATNTMLQSSEQSVEDTKLLQLSVKEQLLESNKYIEETISDIKEEKATTTEKLLNIALSLQELQESVSEMSTVNIVTKQDRDKYKDDVSDCPDSEQIAVEIIAELEKKGVTVNYKVIKENITAETNGGKNTETEVDKDDVFGTEEEFGEETDEETERNTDNREEESTLLQILKSPANTSEEENDEDEIVMESESYDSSSVSNTNITLNSSSFQGQHRFDLQTNKNSSKDKAESIKPAEVTIQIIPHNNISLQLGNKNQDQLIGLLHLHNVAAIIHNSDATVNQQRPQPTLAIVHAIPTHNGNKTNVSQINTGDRDIEVDKNLQPNVNATAYEELKYINGTFAYNQSENSDVAHNTAVHVNGITITSNDDKIKSNCSSEDHDMGSKASQSSATSLLIIRKDENFPTAAIKENRSSGVDLLSENILLVNHSTHNSSQSGQTLNMCEKENATSNSTNLTLKNVTESNSTGTEVESEVQVPAPLKRLMKLHFKEGKHNLTLQDFWRDLLEKKELGQNVTFGQNSAENQDMSQVKNKSSTLFTIDAIQNLVSALNDTEDRNYGIQRQQYLSRLQELATELVNWKDGSALERTDHLKSTNRTDEIRETISRDGNKQQLNR